MSGASGTPGVGGLCAVWILLTALACAAGPIKNGAHYEDGARGWKLADLSQLDSDWERFSQDGVELAFRGPGRKTMSLLLRCRAGRGDSQALARHLLIGLDERHVESEGEVTVGGQRGWLQQVAARAGSEPVHLRTVTLRAGKCTYDWLLVAPGEFGDAEALFDSWWSSLRLSEVESP